MTLDRPVVMSLSFLVSGQPVPYDRNAVAWRTTPPANRAWRETVRAAFQRVADASGHKDFHTHEGAVSVHLGFLGERVTSDLDNLSKEVHDALNGVAWEDDRQIAWACQERLPRPQNQKDHGVRVTVTYHVATPDELKRAQAREKARQKRATIGGTP